MAAGHREPFSNNAFNNRLETGQLIDYVFVIDLPETREEIERLEAKATRKADDDDDDDVKAVRKRLVYFCNLRAEGILLLCLHAHALSSVLPSSLGRGGRHPPCPRAEPGRERSIRQGRPESGEFGAVGLHTIIRAPLWRCRSCPFLSSACWKKLRRFTSRKPCEKRSALQPPRVWGMPPKRGIRVETV